MRKLVALALALAASLPASAQPKPARPSGPFVMVGLEVPSLSDLGRVAPELKAAGVNTVVASAPLGAAVIPHLWDAWQLGLSVILQGDALGAVASGEVDEHDLLLHAYDYSSWTRQQHDFFGFLFSPQFGSGLTPQQYTARLLGAEAGNPQARCAPGQWLSGPEVPFGATGQAGREMVAVYLTPQDALTVAPQALRNGIMTAHETASAMGPTRDVLVVFLGDGPQADKLTEAALDAAVAAAQQEPGVSGFLFLRPANDAVRQMQLRVAGKLAGRLGDSAKLRAPYTTRIDVLLSEDSSPLLWRLKRYGEVTTSGLTPYVTPDGSAGYTVGGRALLDLGIPTRSGWADARRLTRFSMRMFSTVEGQGALLALSTAGDVSFVRLPIVSGWHLYDLDLTKAVWESQKPEGQKWGGTTGIVQALTFTPTPAPGSEVAFDWIRLEPDSTGEIIWDMQKAKESVKIEGLAGAAVADGELKGKATGNTVTVDLSVPGGFLEVYALPFLSLKTSATAGTASVEFWYPHDGEKHGGTATFSLQKDLAAQCVDLSRLGFTGAAVPEWDLWGGPDRRISRLRLTLPAEKDKDWSLDWVRLGPNYDLRAVPAEEPPG